MREKVRQKVIDKLDELGGQIAWTHEDVADAVLKVILEAEELIPAHEHDCRPPQGWGDPGDRITCQACGMQWGYIKPFGMYPGWQAMGVVDFEARRQEQLRIMSQNLQRFNATTSGGEG